MTRWIVTCTRWISACAVAAAVGVAAPAGAGSDESARQAFDRFAASWMGKMEKREAENRRQPVVQRAGGRSVATYTGYADDWSIEVQATGDRVSPYVGLLSYQEQSYTCSDETARRCSVSRITPVTEVFGYREGRWSW